ncbi:pantothenate kinase [Oxynema sp. CENA135]|uniref:pantothenate kinase n=1 Tax=Oxynema sp. CENA135 TaxID=984206 RepID=UPI00190A6FE8|nr:pantothenate kinase [Oxynema sp. CENA135]MBK4730771.1 pantothenate kinase [Oxynema sp. CENA135]
MWWLSLSIGNSRLHWGLWCENSLEITWNSGYLGDDRVDEVIRGWREGKLWPSGGEVEPHDLDGIPELAIASVVPEQLGRWQVYPHSRTLGIADLPLQNLYPGLGIDRALALLGAGTRYGWPVLTVDSGTALTLSGADGDRAFVGGAILPGLGLQFRTLARQTAALPEIAVPKTLPPRWATNTADAIRSGIVYTLTAGICEFVRDWRCQFPESAIVLTGGNSEEVAAYLRAIAPDIGERAIADPDLIFWGMGEVYRAGKV